ncbi:DNA polymerase III subunit gamma/tau [Buchnera aphidicola]|uniref:DNA polymerase III subunit gamma/tau n=1 Tax=Buchnera aphidicola TaxID=9 RepID=UPI003464C85C
MNYQILARKYRPQLLTEVIGQKNIIATLFNTLNLKKIHQTWIFSGTRGIGKTSIARLLSKCLNCLSGITANPCRTCQNCKNIEKGCSLDLLEIDAASRTKVEDMRELLESVQYSPTQSRFKIYLIDEVHMLSKHSFNALLKILEEPPKHIKFILATTNIEKIPDTILSRCFKLNLQKISSIDINNHIQYVLKKENIQFEPRAIELLAITADGSIRDALNLTEQAISIDFKKIKTKNVLKIIGGINDYYSFFLTKSLVMQNISEFKSLLSQLNYLSIKWEEVLVAILKTLHHIAMNQMFSSFWKEHNIGEYKENILELSNKIDSKIIHLYYKMILIGRKELKYSPTEKMGVEMIALRLLSIDQEEYILSNSLKYKNIFNINNNKNYVDKISKKEFFLKKNLNKNLNTFNETEILTDKLIKKKKIARNKKKD